MPKQHFKCTFLLLTPLYVSVALYGPLLIVLVQLGSVEHFTKAYRSHCFPASILSSTNSTFMNNKLLNIHQIHGLQVALFRLSCDYDALPEIFSGFFSLTAIITTTLFIFYVVRTNVVLLFLNLLSSSSPFHVAVQDYILQFPHQWKIICNPALTMFSIYYLKNLIKCKYCKVFFNVFNCFCFLMLDVHTRNL